MGNSQSNYPERMLNLKCFQDLNNDIDDFNSKQLHQIDKNIQQKFNKRNQKAMDALGFLIQFDEVNYGGIKGMFKKVFFQQALQKIEINTNMLIDSKPYFFKLKVNEMYTLAELLSRYTEDAETEGNNEDNQQSGSLLKGRRKYSEEQKNEEEEQKQQIKQEKQQQKEIEDEDRQCPLCLDQRIKVVLPCYHGYCDNCARKWIQEKMQKNCPMCRFQVEASQSKFNRTVMHVEDDVSNVNNLVKQQIIQIILSKNNKIPLKNVNIQSE